VLSQLSYGIIWISPKSWGVKNSLLCEKVFFMEISKELLELLLPSFIVNHFIFIRGNSSEEHLHLYFEEKNESALFRGRKVESTGFHKEIIIEDFPLRGKWTYSDYFNGQCKREDRIIRPVLFFSLRRIGMTIFCLDLEKELNWYIRSNQLLTPRMHEYFLKVSSQRNNKQSISFVHCNN